MLKGNTFYHENYVSMFDTVYFQSMHSAAALVFNSTECKKNQMAFTGNCNILGWDKCSFTLRKILLKFMPVFR